MITHAAALLAAGTVGFLVGGAAGAAAGVVVWTAVVLIAWWLLRARNAKALPGPVEPPQPSIYADIDDVIERLDDLARERNWGLGKHFAIARMACENRTMTFDELERRYDGEQKARPAPGS